jgi:hypothetical protein
MPRATSLTKYEKQDNQGGAAFNERNPNTIQQHRQGAQQGTYTSFAAH